jgi:hypothetical protein
MRELGEREVKMSVMIMSEKSQVAYFRRLHFLSLQLPTVKSACETQIRRKSDDW